MNEIWFVVTEKYESKKPSGLKKKQSRAISPFLDANAWNKMKNSSNNNLPQVKKLKV